MVLTGVPQPNVAVLRYLYVPVVAIVSLKVAPVPGRFVQTVKPGPGARAQLYTGPDEAGVPVVAAAGLEMLTVPPGQIPDPEIVPALCAVEYTVSVVLRLFDVHCGEPTYLR